MTSILCSSEESSIVVFDASDCSAGVEEPYELATLGSISIAANIFISRLRLLRLEPNPVVAIGGSASVAILDLGERRLLSTLRCPCRVTGLCGVPLCADPSGLLVAGCVDGGVRVFRWQEAEADSNRTCTQLVSVSTDDHNHGVFVIEHDMFSPNRIILGATHGLIQEYDLGRSSLLCEYPSQDEQRHTSTVWGISCLESYGIFASCSVDSSVRLWSRRSGHCVSSVDVICPCRSIFYAGDLDLLFVGGQRGRILTLDPRNMSKTVEEKFVHQRPPGHHFKYVARSKRIVYEIARLSSDLFVSISNDSNVVVWNPHGDVVATARASQDGAYFASLCVVGDMGADPRDSPLPTPFGGLIDTVVNESKEVVRRMEFLRDLNSDLSFGGIRVLLRDSLIVCHSLGFIMCLTETLW